jgi:AGCS family alanine or glycine:cation symporter
VFMGALFELEAVWNFSDAMNALMAVPNLIGLLLLSGILSRETRIFEKGINEGTINKYN